MLHTGPHRERVAQTPRRATCANIPTIFLWLAVLLACWVTAARGMTDDSVARLRDETAHLFYHGFDNYMAYAYPEDELRPLSCGPLTRDRKNPAHIEVNDVLGNYSLTLIDSLSTLAIIASSPPRGAPSSEPLYDFQDGIQALVELYGDGTAGPSGEGRRARGFDLDSKVQVFETVIRGVGGLLSAHQFAVGDLPIRNYEARVEMKGGREGIFWSNGLVYDGQLLRLAQDLADRLMPAFNTPTRLPYPRVNLRHGVYFYPNSPYNAHAEGECKKRKTDDEEITETCSAGAGSLVLEFSTLSRLTGDARYEKAAKAAFWAVWQRRSNIGLLGAGIDAETGQWVSSYTGIGAGIDSFFEYALKSHILLSGVDPDGDHSDFGSSDAFLQVWEEAHDAVKRNIYRGPVFQHPHYIQVDLYSGASRAFWIDSLSAFYQGLLTLAGELEEAISTHLLYTALWTRYSAMPERWSTATGNIEHGLRWWGGRPEFIESTWYLYRATQDPYYLHVGEMALRDIKRRCWTRCGWAGLQDVRTGELSDRMESFFLGETAKYLFLLFDPEHPLNTWDASWVFTTEGHPLVIPKRLRPAQARHTGTSSPTGIQPVLGTCPLPPASVPFTISATAARSDLFHAAGLARLHLMPTTDMLPTGKQTLEFPDDHPSLSEATAGTASPSNWTFFPWTLPHELIPHNGTSAPMATRTTFDLSFPNSVSGGLQVGLANLQRVHGGIYVKSLSGLRLGMVLEHEPVSLEGLESIFLDEQHFRIHSISGVALGRDEKVYLGRSAVEEFNPLDPYFTRVKDTHTAELVVDVPTSLDADDVETESETVVSGQSTEGLMGSSLSELLEAAFGIGEKRKRNLSVLSENEDGVETIEIELGGEGEDGEPSYLENLLANLQSLLSASLPGSVLPPSTPVPSDESERTDAKTAIPVSSYSSSLSTAKPQTSPKSRSSASTSSPSDQASKKIKPDLQAKPSAKATPKKKTYTTPKPRSASTFSRLSITAALPLGPGAAPLPDVPDADLYNPTNPSPSTLNAATPRLAPLPWKKIYVHDGTLCEERLDADIARTHQVVVVRRGGCSFSEKLRNVPPVPPRSGSLQIVVVVSGAKRDAKHSGEGKEDNAVDEGPIDHKLTRTAAAEEQEEPNHDPEGHFPSPHHDQKAQEASLEADALVQPLLEEVQLTPAGLVRQHPIPLIMVAGGEDTIAQLRRAQGVGLRRRWWVESQGVRIGNLVLV